MGRCVKWSASRVNFGTASFFIYINDLDIGIMSSILRFADDTKI
jgi:hypothetical protein